jgi:hypothetical protein
MNNYTNYLASAFVKFSSDQICCHSSKKRKTLTVISGNGRIASCAAKNQAAGRMRPACYQLDQPGLDEQWRSFVYKVNHSKNPVHVGMAASKVNI